MANIVMQSRSGPDSILHLEVPVGQPDTEFEVEVVVRSKKPSVSQQDYLEFLQKTAGAWQGDFERPEQGEPQERDSFE